MRVRSAVTHLAICLAGICLLLVGPPLSTGYLEALLTGRTLDTISSATTTLDKPSGSYLVYVNKDVRDAESLDTWTTFFTHYEDFTFSMEDVACEVARGDTGAQDMAASFQSQLPEHQMQLTVTDPTLLLSRMAHGRYDMVIMSREFVDAHGGMAAVGGGDCLVLAVGTADVGGSEGGEA